MTTFAWTYSDCVCLPTFNGLTDVARSIAYTCTGTDGPNTATLSGRVQLAEPDPNTFTAFASLTFVIVDGWVQAVLGANGVTSVQACIQGQIDQIVNPPVSPVLMQLPF
jgi:hypothetical protein